MKQGSRAPIIDWPYWGKPFAKTPRGYFCRTNTTRALFKVALGAFLVCFPLFVLYEQAPQSVRIVPVAVAVIAAALHYVLFVRPIRPAVREAREAVEPWRQQWLDFEQKSLALQQQVKDAAYRLEDAYAKAPGFPAYSYRLYNTLDMVMPECGIPYDRQEAVERAPHLMGYALSAVLCSFVRMGGPMVAGRTGDAGVLAIFKPFDGYQVWAKVEFERSGDALVPRLLTGIQTWSHRYQDRWGKRYPGDMVKIKRHHFKGNAAFLFVMIPIVGLILAVIMVIAAIGAYFTTDRVAHFRSELWPACGDSSDPVIMSGYKQAIPGSAQWIFATQEAQGTLDSMKRRILEAVTMSLGRRI